jgi:ParB family chromosome partitioning protein
MTNPLGHIELDRAVSSIWFGKRHRQDLGDIDALAASIDQDGLLQAITIAPDGMLLCGRRRVEAIRLLGWKSVNVWVRSGISSRLGQLLAERDDNLLHKPLTPTEEAALYQELKTVMAEDAARRQHATRFGSATEIGEISGGAESAPPSDRKSRAQAAQLVTGTNSYTRLEQVTEIQQLASTPDTPAALREFATAELSRMDADGTVFSHYQRVKAAQAEHDAELHHLADQALARVSAEKKHKPLPRAPRTGADPVRQYTVRAFLLTWDEMSGWSEHYDPIIVGQALSAEQWARFEATVAATIAFAEKAREARTSAQA